MFSSLTSFLASNKQTVLYVTATTATVGVTSIILRFLYQKYKNPLHIIWDLDATLISSHLLPECKDKFPSKEFPEHFDHIDDDFPFDKSMLIPNTRTWFRPYAKLVLKILSYFTVQHVFTSAQKTYTDNILKELDPQRKLFKVVLHRDLYPKRFLGKNGKDIMDILKDKKLLKRSVLIDDQKRYLTPHPQNGILIKPFGDIKDGKFDKELLKLLWIFIKCHFYSEVSKTIKQYKYNPEV